MQHQGVWSLQEVCHVRHRSCWKGSRCNEFSQENPWTSNLETVKTNLRITIGKHQTLKRQDEFKSYLQSVSHCLSFWWQITWLNSHCLAPGSFTPTVASAKLTLRTELTGIITGRFWMHSTLKWLLRNFVTLDYLKKSNATSGNILLQCVVFEKKMMRQTKVLRQDTKIWLERYLGGENNDRKQKKLCNDSIIKM